MCAAATTQAEEDGKGGMYAVKYVRPAKLEKNVPRARIRLTEEEQLALEEEARKAAEEAKRKKNAPKPIKVVDKLDSYTHDLKDGAIPDSPVSLWGADSPVASPANSPKGPKRKSKFQR